MQSISTIGLDIAKLIFQVHGVGPPSAEFIGYVARLARMRGPEDRFPRGRSNTVRVHEFRSLHRDIGSQSTSLAP